jgi:hypothetical protein
MRSSEILRLRYLGIKCGTTRNDAGPSLHRHGAGNKPALELEEALEAFGQVLVTGVLPPAPAPRPRARVRMSSCGAHEARAAEAKTQEDETRAAEVKLKEG